MCKINIRLENNINIKGNISVNFEQFCSDIIKGEFCRCGRYGNQ